jgi:hypothetical protein
MSLCVHTIYKVELSEIYAKGNDMTTEMTNRDNFKTRLYKERRKCLGTEQNSGEI